MGLFVSPIIASPIFMAAGAGTGIDLYVSAVQQIDSLTAGRTMVPVVEVLPVTRQLHEALQAIEAPGTQIEHVGLMVEYMEGLSASEPEAVIASNALVGNLRHDWILPLPLEEARDAAERLKRLTEGGLQRLERGTTIVYHSMRRSPWERLRGALGNLLVHWGHHVRPTDMEFHARRTLVEAEPASPADDQVTTAPPAAEPPANLTDPETGRLLIRQGFRVGDEVVEGVALSEYKLQGVAGEGAMGRVYKALEIGTDRTVAIKIASPPETSVRQVFMDLFDNEKRMQGGAESERITRVYATGVTARGEPFIVMEFLEGGTLEDYMEEVEDNGRPFGLDEAVSFGLQAVAAVAEAHELGIVHKDVKPGNFFVADGKLKLGDFGIAERLDEIKQERNENIRGTPLYMPLETWHGEFDTYRRDVYALGVVLYELLTGRLPYIPEGTNLMSLAVKLAQNEPPPVPPSEVNMLRDTPKALDRIVMKALARDHDDRYADANELLFDLATYRAQALEEEALKYLKPSWANRNERNRNMDQWCKLMEMALSEYYRVYDQFPQQGILERILEISLGLHTWFDIKGLARSRQRVTGDILRVLGMAPELDRERNIAAAVSRRVSIQLQFDRPPQATGPLKVSSGRFEERNGHLEWDHESVRPLAASDLEDPLDLEWGPVHAIRVDGEGLYPVFIPLPTRPSRDPHVVRIPLYADEEIPPDFLVIPAGPVAVRNYPGLYGEQTDEWRSVGHDYAIGHKVTNGEYLGYLSVLHRKYGEGIGDKMPRHWHEDALKLIVSDRPIHAGRLKDRDGRPLHPEAAVTGVSYDDGLAYLQWAYPDRGARYPTLNEWRRVVRANDSRTYPWGDASPEANFANWRITGEFTPSQILPNAARETLDVSPFSHFGAAGLETGLRFLVSGTYSFITNDNAELYLPAAGLHEVDPTNPREVERWALLVGQPFNAPPPTGIETLTPDTRHHARLLELTGIIPVIPLRQAEPTPRRATMRQ